MKYYVLAELRENHDNVLATKSTYNDYVSKKSMKDLVDACCRNGYDCEFLGGIKELKNFIFKHNNTRDCIFINYNYGTPAKYKRGQCPIILESINAKYSGSDPLTSLIVNDKYFCKKIIKDKINVPKSILLLSKNEISDMLLDDLNYPVIVKPNCEGSSLGIDENSYCDSVNSAKSKALSLLNDYSPILIEEYVSGFEVTVWIIGNKDNYKLIQPLIISSNGKFYFENKIFTIIDKANHKRNYCLPDTVLPSNIVDEIISYSKTIFEELGMKDYGRIDFRISGNNVYFIEANALPIFSKTSEIGEITKLCNISYDNICKKLIEAITDRLVSETD